MLCRIRQVPLVYHFRTFIFTGMDAPTAMLRGTGFNCTVLLVSCGVKREGYPRLYYNLFFFLGVYLP